MKKKASKHFKAARSKWSFQTLFSGDNKLLPWFILSVSTFFVVFVRWSLASLPLERDEGEYAYMGQCILDGIPPYMEAANMKLPGAYYMYAIIMSIFGETARGIHIGLLVIILCSMYLLFLLGQKMADSLSGAITAASFGLFTLVPGTYGLAAHATHFIALFAIAALLILLKANERRSIVFYALGGLLLGLAFIVKQQAVFLLIFGALVLLYQELKFYKGKGKSLFIALLVYSFSAILPYLLVVMLALTNGSFDKFWHWTVEYARQYAGIYDLKSGYDSLLATMGLITKGVWGLWVMALVGIVALFFSPRLRKFRFIVLTFFLFTFLTTVPGFYFRNHYFISFFPALALLTGLAFYFLKELIAKWKQPIAAYFSAAAFSGLFIVAIGVHRGFYFDYSVREVCARLYGANHFLESQVVADFVSKNSLPDERILVFGSEPQIYFYSGRKAATSFLYTYSLMENQLYSKGMQEEMKLEIEQNKPKFLIYINNNFSWLRGPDSDNYIIEWCEQYASSFYNTVGFVDLIAPGNAIYVWGEDVYSYTPQGADRIVIMQRR